MRALLLFPLVLVLGCATLAESPGGGDALPNASAGPFRATVSGEIGNSRAAPNALEDLNDLSRDGFVLDLDGDPTTLAVAGFFAANPRGTGPVADPSDPPTAIERYDALDGRSFANASEVVLSASAAWEGGTIGAPDAVRMGDEVFLYYAGEGGVGLARGDGHHFTREPAPVLAAATSGWDAGLTPTSPGVVVLDSGELRMFYEVELATGSAIGEASSKDGVTWTRVGVAPALAPSGSDYDAASVGAPAPVLATSATGRAELSLYYAAVDAAGTRTIGLAARFGDDGPLDRAVSAVYGTSNDYAPTEPCVVAFDGFTLLFATEQASSTDTQAATVAGVAPATATLPPPNPD